MSQNAVTLSGDGADRIASFDAVRDYGSSLFRRNACAEHSEAQTLRRTIFYERTSTNPKLHWQPT